jgi:type II secretory pathway pseudopilin PulG
VISSKLILRSCTVLSVVGFLLAVVLALQYRAENTARLDAALANAQQISERAREQIADKLVIIAEEVNRAAANSLRNGTPSKETIHGIIRNLVYSDPGFLEVGAAFAPFAYHPRIRLYGPAYVIEKDGVRFKILDAGQDYTKPDADWYHRPMEGAALWLAPRFDKDRGHALVTYGAPLRRPGGASEPLGVLFATYSLSIFQGLLDSLDLGQNGHSFVLSSEKRFILHPNRDFSEQQTPFEKFLERVASPRDATSIETAFRTPTSIASFVDPDTGLLSRVLFRRIAATDWTLGVVLADRDLLMPPQVAQRKLIDIALIIAISIVLLAIALAKIDRDLTRGLWIVSSVFAASCILVGMFVVTLAMRQQIPEGDHVTRITNWNSLNRFTSEQRRRTLAQREEVPLFIPTGIYIQSAFLEDATNVGISGYVWQRYTKGVHDGIQRGFIMPDAKESTVTQAYTIEDGDTELVRWNIHATVNQNFAYSRYPFDSERIVVDLWHKEFTNNVILIPDLASYKLMSPAARPGLFEKLQLSGWNVGDSSFNYVNENYKTSFGLRGFAGLTNYPNLYFGFDIRKEITGPFVANMLPLLVVTILLFAILFLGTREESHKGRLGFALDVIAACAGFFLVAILLHIALRRDLAVRDIFYLEYFYFVTYAMILYVAVNYVLFMKTAIRLVHYRDNFIAKVVFWPVSQFALLWFTLMAFY